MTSDEALADTNNHNPHTLTRQQLELMYDNISDLIFLLEVTGDGGYQLKSVNAAYLARMQVRAEDVVGRPIEQVLNPEDYAYVKARYDEAVANRGPWNYETRTTMQGVTVYLNTTLVPVFDDAGACAHLIGVSRDITRSKMEQRALQSEKQRAENYLDIAEAVIVAIDRNGDIKLLNRKGYAMLGYPEGSLTGENWIGRCIEPDKAERFLAGFRRMIETGITSRNVNYVRTRGGERILISWSNAIIRDDAGRVVGILSSGEDITSRHRAEQAMIASQRVLAADEVVSAVAHDFNNSLQGILGNIELALVLAADSEPLRAHLQAAGKLAEDAARRLRVLRGVGAGNPAREFEPLDVHELIDDVIAQTRPLWKDEAQRHGRDVTVIRELSDRVLPVNGNRSELRSVLYNVVKNSIEALTDHGEVRFVTRFERGHDVITVTDTGMGMDLETSTRVFQPFFSTKGLEAGRGLGMSASHQIVRSHGGEIRVRNSAPGAGTTMEIRLPAMTAQRARAAALPVASAATRHHVLWVDDDPDIRALARVYLETLHHSGDVAASGGEALELMRRSDYSVVVTDVGMPVMNGLELARQVHDHSGGRVPVVALTGWGESVAEGQTLPAGIVRVVAKPIHLDMLREVLETLPNARVRSG